MPEVTFNKVEIKIAKLICQQFTNAEIAEKVDRSTRTVEAIRLAMIKKMKVKNAVGIAFYAVKKGWHTLR